jgi:hypothetical protein
MRDGLTEIFGRCGDIRNDISFLQGVGADLFDDRDIACVESRRAHGVGKHDEEAETENVAVGLIEGRYGNDRKDRHTDSENDEDPNENVGKRFQNFFRVVHWENSP